MSNLELKTLEKTVPSIEAQELAAQMLASDLISSNVQDIRRQLAEEFEPRSARALKRFNTTLSISFIGSIKCLVIEPKIRVSVGSILYLFGGGYVSGAPEYELPIAAFLSEHCGMRVVLPYYSLAPEHPFPAALNEVVAVYEAMSREPNSGTIICGESSGGGLALLIQTRLKAREVVQPLGLCLFSPWVDLTEDGLALSAQIQDPATDHEFLRVSANAYCDEQERTHASPYFDRYSEKSPRMFISTGSSDIMQLGLQKFTKRLLKLGVDVQLRIWPGMWHVFELYDELPEANLSLHEAALFINDIM